MSNWTRTQLQPGSICGHARTPRTPTEVGQPFSTKTRTGLRSVGRGCSQVIGHAARDLSATIGCSVDPETPHPASLTLRCRARSRIHGSHDRVLTPLRQTASAVFSSSTMSGSNVCTDRRDLTSLPALRTEPILKSAYSRSPQRSCDSLLQRPGF